jgi:hypothetical protein
MPLVQLFSLIRFLAPELGYNLFPRNVEESEKGFSPFSAFIFSTPLKLLHLQAEATSCSFSCSLAC